MSTTDTTVKIVLSRRHHVISITNNNECPGYAKLGLCVGDKVSTDFKALLMMNPQRFALSYQPA